MTKFHAGNLVREARKAKGVSQVELARRIGSKQSRISHIEKSERLTTETLSRIAEALGVTFEL